MSASAFAAASPWRGVFSALCACLLGIGLARFAYTPLLPVIVTEGWFSASAAAYLGAANLAGYLAGALGGRAAGARFGTAASLRVAMGFAAAAFFGCALPLSFAWYFFWRFGAGVAGGVVMVLAAPSVLPLVAPGRRGFAGGLIFTGVAIGIAASGTLLPLLLRYGLAATWCGLGVLAVMLVGAGWGGWPETARPQSSEAPAGAPQQTWSAPLLAICAAYALNAAGLVPHMVFLSDYIARGLGKGATAGAGYWVLFGIGALAGATLAGVVADRIGFRTTLRLAFVLQIIAVGGLALTEATPVLLLSTFVAGAFVPAISTVVLGRLLELFGHRPALARFGWMAATVGFAIGQASAAYGFSYLYGAYGVGYPTLFALAAAALTLALALELATPAPTVEANPPGR